MTDRPEPSDRVFAAFGVADEPRERLAGGRGLTWRAGPVVVRPTGDVDEATWRADLLAHLEHTPEFRTPRPIRADSGTWVVDGWEAWQWVPGAADETRVSEVIRAGDAFHRAIAGLERPAFIDTVDDPWARADRMVWGGEPLPADPTLERLAAAFGPVESPAQLIHGDLLGNVLFASGLPPAIIDWPPYWRPAGLGAAIAVVDAVCWYGTPIGSVPELGRGVAEWEQLLVRALAFRITTLQLVGAWGPAARERHAPVVDAIVRGAAAGDVHRWLDGLSGLLGVDYLFQDVLGYHDGCEPADGHLMRLVFAGAEALNDHLDHGSSLGDHLGDEIVGDVLMHVRALLDGATDGRPSTDRQGAWDWARRVERERPDLDRATLRSVLFTTLALVFDDPPPVLRPVIAADAALARLRTALRERYGRPDPESPVTRMARSMATRWADTVATYVPPDHPAARRAH